MGAALHAVVVFMAEALKIFFGFLLTFSSQLGKISCNWMKSFDRGVVGPVWYVFLNAPYLQEQ